MAAALAVAEAAPLTETKLVAARTVEEAAAVRAAGRESCTGTLLRR